MASAAHDPPSSSAPFERVAHPATLLAAWHHVRRAAEASRSPSIRGEARRFADDAERHLERIAAEIRADRFQFAPALGVAQPRPGKRARPIVIAPIESRVVARALLDVLL